jgi:uncharacterized protein YuzE
MAIQNPVRQNGPQRISRSSIQAMKIRYFTDTHTVYIEFREAAVVETRDLGEDAVNDLDADGEICAITLEHASAHAGLPNISIEHVAA